MRVTEVIVRLLRELVQHGWKANASPQLFQQLLIFILLIIGGVPGQPKQGVPEETTIEGFRTLAALLGVAEPAHLAPPAESPSEVKEIPVLAPSIEVILDGVTEGVIPQIQLEALQCLRTVFSSVRDNKVLAQVLPGTVSALTKVLSPPQSNHSQKKVLVGCLEVLKLVLTSVLGDIKVRGLLKKPEQPAGTAAEATSEPGKSASQVELTPSWLKATASQIKLALSAVLKLRAHEAEDVQVALRRLCLALLDECHASLADCQSILVETAMILENEDAPRSHLETTLQDLAGVYPELGDSIKSALYNWITTLPRVVQSSDERVKQLAIRSILRGSKLAAALQMDSSTLEDALGDSLRDSIITLVKGSKQARIVDDAGADISTSTDLVRHGELATYAPVLLDSESQRTTRKEISSLITSIGSAAQQVKLAASMLGYIRDSEGVDQIASFWLAFELLKATYTQSAELDDLFDLSSLGESRDREEAFQELYDFSASVLGSHSDSVDADWRLEGIALEVTAFSASRLKLDFRPELIDVLYPITTFLGSPVPQLRRHAITTLNIIAASCGYDSVPDLVVDNADYMVNSISLRLNTFDISPASTKVLTMVIRLTGPRLIPFLDDVVAAVFAALDNYHGYPVFVESLFAVLSEVVTQGIKSDAQLLAPANATKPTSHRKTPPTSPGIPGILQTLTARLDRAARSQAEATTPLPPHPQKPWAPPKPSQAQSLLDKLTNPDEDEDEDDQQQDTTSAPSTELTLPPTTTLLTKILTHTQNHLTSPSPTLRLNLLNLITTSAPTLSAATGEEAFLPIVNALWPVLITRLRDAEGYVVVAACRALGGVCEAAGDFLSSRGRGEWWGPKGLGAWVKTIKREADANKGSVGKRMRVGVGEGKREEETGGVLIPVEGGGGGGEGRVVKSSLGRFAQASVVWEAVVGLLEAVVGYVRVEEEMFDEILGLVMDVLPRREGLRRALEAVNADAVWLAMFERGMVGVGEMPVVEGFRFAAVEGREVVVGGYVG